MKITVITDLRCAKCGKQFQDEFPDTGSAISWLQDDMEVFYIPGSTSFEHGGVCLDCRAAWREFRDRKLKDAAKEFLG